MKSTFSNQKQKVRKFPKLMIRKKDRTIVYFTSVGVGCLVHCDCGNTASTPYFHHSKYWNPDNFEDFEGEVVLSND